MNNTISKHFAIKENNLYFNDCDFTELFLHNKKSCFKWHLYDNYLDLTEFISVNEYLLFNSNTFLLSKKRDSNIESEEDNFKPTDGNIRISKLSSQSICSNLKIHSIKHDYLLDIYIDERGLLIIHIERVQDNSKIDIHSIFLDESNNLNLHISSNKNIVEAGIALFDNDCNLVPYMANSVTDSSIVFKLDLTNLLKYNSSLFHANLILNGRIYPLIMKKSYFKTFIISDTASTKGIHYKTEILPDDTNYLTVQLDNSISFEGNVTKICIVDQKISINGFIKTTLDLSNKDLFDLKLKLDTYVIEDFILNDDNTFIAHLDSISLSSLKCRPSKISTLNFEVLFKNTNDIINYKASSNLPLIEGLNQNTIFSDIIDDDNLKAFSITATQSKDSIEFNISNPIHINSIEKVKVNKKNIIFRMDCTYSTSSKVHISLNIEDKIIPATSVKRKDNFITCAFSDPSWGELNSTQKVIEYLLENEFNIDSKVGAIDFTQNIDHLNEDIIIKCNKDALLKSKFFNKIIQLLNKKQ